MQTIGIIGFDFCEPEAVSDFLSAWEPSVEVCDASFQACNDLGGIGHVGRRQHDEFVASDTGNDVAFSEGPLQHIREPLDHLRSDLMAQGVIDALQPVEIEEIDDKRRSVPSGRFCDVVGDREEATTVKCFGEFVRH